MFVELIGVHVVPLENEVRATVHKEGCVGVDGDALRAHGGDSGCGGRLADKVHVYVAVDLEERRDDKPLVGVASEGIDQHVDLRVFVLLEDPVHHVGSEVARPAGADFTLEEDVEIFWHSSAKNYAPKISIPQGGKKDYKTQGSADFRAIWVIL